MRLRSTILFLLLVAVPLALIAWLGVMLLRQEGEQARASWMGVIEERLAAADGVLGQEMSRLEIEFDDLLKSTTLDETSLHELPRTLPLVRHAFLLDARGHLLFPRPNGGAQGESAAFVRRTESVWESGVRFGSGKARAIKESNQAPSPEQGPSRLLLSAAAPGDLLQEGGRAARAQGSGEGRHSRSGGRIQRLACVVLRRWAADAFLAGAR